MPPSDLVPYTVPDQDADLLQCGRVDSDRCRRCRDFVDSHGGNRVCKRCRTEAYKPKLAVTKESRPLDREKSDHDRCRCGHIRNNHHQYSYHDSCRVCECQGFRLRSALLANGERVTYA